MQRKNNKPIPPRKTVVTSGKIRRKKSANAPNSMGLYRTPPSGALTPGATSSPVLGFGGGYRGQKFQIPKGLNISKGGMAFLKCAFAPPDFGETLATGVPDSFEGTSLVKKHRGVFSATIQPSLDRYILLMPVPGISYFYCDVAAGTALSATSVFHGVPYSDFTSLFGDPSGIEASDVVDKFRFVSNHIELVPTVNAVSWTGSVQCWKLPLQLQVKGLTPGIGAGATSYTITGGQGVNATNPNQYTAPFNHGVYTAAYNTGQAFAFQPTLENLAVLPLATTPSDFLQFDFVGPLGTPIACFPGFDNNFDSVLIKISGCGTNPNNSYILKTWACVEYQVVPGTSLYEYQSISSRDEVAMMLYRKIIRELPVGKTYMDNDTFWQSVLGIIRMISGGLSYLPGPYGQIAGGINTAANGLQLLTN